MNALVEKYKNEPRWVAWEYKTTPDGKKTKVPLGKSDTPSTWTTYEKAKAKKKGIGIMFGVDNTFLGVDIDHCVEDGKIVHEKEKEIKAFLREANSYTELSPSETGIHVYFALSEPLELSMNKKAPYEYYTAKRFFTVSEKPFGKQREVRMLSKQEALNLLGMIEYAEKEKRERVTVVSTITLDDEQILGKLFSEKKGSEFKALWNGDTTMYGDDESNADMALCSKLAFYTGNNYDQIERIWMSSPLGARHKTQEREDYRRRTIEKAIESTTEVYTTKAHTIVQEVTVPIATTLSDEIKESIEEVVTTLDEYVTRSTKNGEVFVQQLSNVLKFLEKVYKNKIRYNEFKRKIEVYDNKEWAQITDEYFIQVQVELQNHASGWFLNVNKQTVIDAVILCAMRYKIHPLKEYFTSLSWDGVSRLDRWIIEVYGTEDTEYYRKIGLSWLMGAVKRVIHPGSQYDYVLVLIGKQGTKKSTSLRELGTFINESWHTEVTKTPDDKDFYLQLEGKMIVEFSEGETLSRTAVKKMKSVITSTEDPIRKPYARTMEHVKRQCVFAMTTNEEEFLKDNTGNRRWIPVTLSREANIEWLSENKEQLYAEAYYRAIVLKEITYDIPIEEAIEKQNQHLVRSPNEDAYVEWYESLSESRKRMGVNINEAYSDVEASDKEKIGIIPSKFKQMEIANIFRDTLKLKNKNKKINGLVKRRWFREGLEIEDDDEVIGVKHTVNNEIYTSLEQIQGLNEEF